MSTIADMENVSGRFCPDAFFNFQGGSWIW